MVYNKRLGDKNELTNSMDILYINYVAYKYTCCCGTVGSASPW